MRTSGADDRRGSAEPTSDGLARDPSWIGIEDDEKRVTNRRGQGLGKQASAQKVNMERTLRAFSEGCQWERGEHDDPAGIRLSPVRRNSHWKPEDSPTYIRYLVLFPPIVSVNCRADATTNGAFPASRTRTTPSAPAVAKRVPSGLKATVGTMSVWPRRIKTSWPVSTSQSLDGLILAGGCQPAAIRAEGHAENRSHVAL